MLSSPTKTSMQEVFGPTEDDMLFFRQYGIFLESVTQGKSGEPYCSLYNHLAIRFISHFAGRVDVRKSIAEMITRIHHPLASVYRRAVCRIAIAFLCRLYVIEEHDYSDLAALAQECVEILQSAKPSCGAEHYELYFVRLETFAAVLKGWHAKKTPVKDSTNSSAGKFKTEDEEMMDVDGVDEVEETTELLKQHAISEQ